VHGYTLHRTCVIYVQSIFLQACHRLPRPSESDATSHEAALPFRSYSAIDGKTHISTSSTKCNVLVRSNVDMELIKLPFAKLLYLNPFLPVVASTFQHSYPEYAAFLTFLSLLPIARPHNRGRAITGRLHTHAPHLKDLGDWDLRVAQPAVSRSTWKSRFLSRLTPLHPPPDRF
jgi:hypothetical protein